MFLLLLGILGLVTLVLMLWKLFFWLCNIPNINKNPIGFFSCRFIGKSPHLPFVSSNTVYAKPFYLVFIDFDLWGPAPFPSPSGYKYHVTFVNTRFTWFYLLKNKSDTLETFKLFKSMALNKFNYSIKAIQYDWGREFRPFTKFLSDHGIQHKLIYPHTTERKHMDIIVLGLTLLSRAKLPLHYWDHAFVSNIYLINRLPSSAINHEVPYQKLSLILKSIWFFLFPSSQTLK